MSATPRISVVTSSFNQGRYIARTIESVLAQQYPNLEHIVVDGMSSDETVDVLARYPHLTVVREPDSGQADAINKGFRRATGEIFCFLNSDDTFAPGALERVAREVEPARGRHVVMGRCRFIDEHDRFIGVEHPSEFESHRRVLEIWKGYAIPQPAVFWTREVWERSGPLDEREHLVLDYDLFCRFSRDYDFHTVDQIFANYRLHEQSKTQGVDDEKRLHDAVTVSRRYWGAPWTPQGAAIRLSWATYRFDRRGRAWRNLSAGKAAWRAGRSGEAAARVTAGALLGPDVALTGLSGPIAQRVVGQVRRGLRWVRRTRRIPPHPNTVAWRGFTGLHPDGWAGPQLELEFDRPAGPDAALGFEGVAPVPLGSPLTLTFAVPGAPPVSVHVEKDRAIHARLPIGHLTPGSHRLSVEATAYFVPHDLTGNGDYRPLSFKMVRVTVNDVTLREVL
jgi:glycosyltransferase involved in cell wall biosynthesis